MRRRYLLGNPSADIILEIHDSALLLFLFSCTSEEVIALWGYWRFATSLIQCSRFCRKTPKERESMALGKTCTSNFHPSLMSPLALPHLSTQDQCSITVDTGALGPAVEQGAWCRAFLCSCFGWAGGSAVAPAQLMYTPKARGGTPAR